MRSCSSWVLGSRFVADEASGAQTSRLRTFEGVVLDELAARLDLVAHQDGEDARRPRRRPRPRTWSSVGAGGVHRGLPELLGVHLAEALVALPNPQRVLIVGGGDGMCLREVCRHKEVQKIIVVEIDPMVVQASKEYLKLVPPEIFDDPRVEIVYADASEYVQDPQNENSFDVILADTLDPLGPAENLFEPEFYEAMYTALKPNGIACTQGENFWIHFDLVRDLMVCCSEIFDHADYATTNVPSYPCGQIGFVLARKSNGGTAKTRGCSTPVRTPSFQDDLKWYNPEMHTRAFVLPQFMKVELNSPDVNMNGRIGTGADDHFNNYEDENDEGDRCFLAGCSIQ